ncbi:MAG: helix-turn-helix transcriptional regulator [Microcoleus sp. PH2017_27_LUM_O_A]|nr:helix-turn-helix transcriptional regulator [Microcoleus sp. PH2017_11_PCY_U_A]MCC3482470.1 helix-turn-helix transcriptional regulator [Microcoleus sp. PH2017_12_PCY_D_A]MCC3531109.1 helix-turn-helix transcriptional regulator [Microcoleus sp. PH2017_21_RUC_O_A]MCC3543435.1 helix-turn-helix transcriptional regulator [Microcoleus sp. PH2017_22_RUC_O_B]MCC3563475.1 helix-turn-helix transcriptional regulator [Microcoleus sp. PH2017_27_LUM_O_A]TAE78790.1 MAG: hypothetical protein EAZ83_23905 [Osc
MTYMSTVDILLLKILNKKTCGKSIREIQNELRTVNINLCQRGIYQRLERMKERQLVARKWEKKTRLYAILDAGKFKLVIFQEQLRA